MDLLSQRMFAGRGLKKLPGERWGMVFNRDVVSALYGIAWSGSMFVAVGDSGVVTTSPPPAPSSMYPLPQWS